jgi:hypothetical protein
MAQNWFLVASGLLILGLGVFHSLLGEIYLVRRLLRREDLPHLFGGDSFTKLTIRYAWHLLTILCVASAAILFYIAPKQDAAFTPIAGILSVTFAVCGVWGLVATRGRHLSWIVLLVAALLAGLGAP